MAEEAWGSRSEECTIMRTFPKSVGIPKQIKPAQAELIYNRMVPYNEEGNVILEIGTRLGYSASIIAQAAPLAKVITLEPLSNRVSKAREYLAPFPNITVVQAYSWDYLETYEGPELSAVFVDGDHKRAHKDVPWYYKLKPGGLILFHDYTEKGSIHVVRAVDLLAGFQGRKLDIRVIDEEGAGMAGMYR